MSFINKVIDFISELFRSLNNGTLFFGGVGDLVRAFFDIFLITILLYLMLLFIKHSRAWQLVKGIIFVCAFVLLCNLLGLELVGYVFSNFLYIFAIMFVVIFQPELRRILETVGIKSFTSLKGMLGAGSNDTDKTRLSNLIHEICLACKEMSKSYTGALILIERNTRLDELLMQENVVKFESSVTNSVLQSLFYKGAPMHDGAVLIRNGTIIAARCHVPLSVTMHSLDRTGTRHRAAVGASEMGDTIAIAVSEERGKTSIAVNGKLYEMQNSSELEANLKYLLGVTAVEDNKGGLKKAFGFRKKKVVTAETKPAPDLAVAKEGKMEGTYMLKTVEAERKDLFGSQTLAASISEKIVLAVISLLLSFGLWIYVQITNNPVITKQITVPISYDQELPSQYEYQYIVDTVTVDIVGRQKVIENLQPKDVVATIDYSNVTDPGVKELPIKVEPRDDHVYFRVDKVQHDTVSVTIYEKSSDK